MQVAIHLGAHCTDEDRLLKSLLQNADLLSKEGISVPGPGRHRKTLNDVTAKLAGARASQDTQAMLRDAILDDDSAERVVLANENFLCVHGWIFDNGLLCGKSDFKTEWLRNVFPDDQVEFFLGIRNPATFIPAAFRHPNQVKEDFADFLSNADVTDIRWSDVLVSILESNPECPITVWCNEYTPFIWPEVMREVSGHDAFTRMMGGFNILGTIMRREGMRRLRAYLGEHPPTNEIQRRRIISAFLDKFAIEDEIEDEIDLPGWTEILVQEMTELYEEDLFEIQKLPRVKLITP